MTRTASWSVIIEDNRYMRESWQTIIDFDMAEGHRSFPECEEALRVPKIADADVIIMDIELPGMSGIERRERNQATISPNDDHHGHCL